MAGGALTGMCAVRCVVAAAGEWGARAPLRRGAGGGAGRWGGCGGGAVASSESERAATVRPSRTVVPQARAGGFAGGVGRHQQGAQEYACQTKLVLAMGGIKLS